MEEEKQKRITSILKAIRALEMQVIQEVYYDKTENL